MLGSLSEAVAAVQETWLRLQRAGGDAIDNPDASLTTVISWICLNVLRTRRDHDPLDLSAEPLVSMDDAVDPEQEALLADAVGVALQVVLDALTPADRLAFVLHDMFSVPFDEIATLVERAPQQPGSSPAARDGACATAPARRRAAPGSGHRASALRSMRPGRESVLTGRFLAQVRAERARRRGRDARTYFAAAREGDIAGLVEVLDPEVVLRAQKESRTREWPL